MMRAKMKCTKKEAVGEVVNMVFAPVYDGSMENKEFFKYTPSGSINLNVVNPDAAAMIEQGKEYYVDFTAAE